MLEFVSYTVPSILHKHVQADATAYFGSVQVSASPGIDIFKFRIVFNLSEFGNDLDAIVITLVRSNLVEKIFSFSDGQSQRTFAIGFNGGIDAVNASRVFPEIRLIENRLVVFEDSVIYQEAPSTDSELQLPTTFHFDLNLIIVGRDSVTIEQFFPFAIGTVVLTLPLDECQNDDCTPGSANFGDFNCSQNNGCEPNPCQNDAVCTNNVYFECFCNARWMDEQCEAIIDYCASVMPIHGPCDENTGAIHCIDESSMYSCTCAAGFTGYNCSEDIDECDPNPCHNGAVCTNLLHGSFECSCNIGWTGQLCDLDIDYCASDSFPHGPCDDIGATNCTDSNSTYFCTCAAGFTGYNCSEDIDECNPNPCHNGAVCTNLLHGAFECSCRVGWTGKLCEVDIDFCMSDSSFYGPCDDIGATNCTDGNSTYVCTCDVGFTGYNCSEDIDECDPNPCENSINCTNLPYGSFECHCYPGWSGQLCEIDIDYCASNSSHHGPCDDLGATNCTDSNSTYSCTCAVGFTGYNCSEDIDECDPNPCQNDAVCMNLLHGSFQCLCGVGWTGELCDIDIDYCISDSSLHGPCDDIGATNCTDANSTYVCTCAVGFTGYNCSQDINECDPNPCQNGGNCTNHDLHGLYECACPSGFSGEMCNSFSNPCAPSQPCSHEVERSSGMYNCNCLCIAQCPLFTFGNHSTGYCQPCKLIMINESMLAQWSLNHNDSLINMRKICIVTQVCGATYLNIVIQQSHRQRKILGAGGGGKRH